MKFQLDKLIDGSLLFQLIERGILYSGPTSRQTKEFVHKDIKYTAKFEFITYSTTNIVYNVGKKELVIRIGGSSFTIVYTTLPDNFQDGIENTDLLLELIPLAFKTLKDTTPIY